MAEDHEKKTEHDSVEQALQGAGSRDTSIGKGPDDVLDLSQVRADDCEILHGKTTIGQEVNRPLRILVLGELPHGDGPRELFGPHRGESGLSGICHTSHFP